MEPNEEGKKELERIKQEYLVDPQELEIFRCQALLERMYWCHEEMADLLDDGIKDSDYVTMGKLIQRLEEHLQNKQDLM